MDSLTSGQSAMTTRFHDTFSDAKLFKRIASDMSWSLVLIDLMTITEPPTSLDESLKLMSPMLARMNPTVNPEDTIRECVVECKALIDAQRTDGTLPPSISDVDAMHLCSLTSEEFPVYRWASNPFRDCALRFKARKDEATGPIVITADNKQDWLSQDVIAAAAYYKGLFVAIDGLPESFQHSGKVFRGIKHQFSPEEFSVNFKNGRCITFFEPRSTSTDRDIASGFGGGTLNPGITLFEIESCRGFNMKWLSFFASEAEVLMPMLSTFEVVAADNSDPLCHVVKLKQKKEMPISFLCPLSREIMTDPATAQDGRAYEMEILLQEINAGEWNTTPATNPCELRTNKPLQQAIEQYNLGQDTEMVKLFECGISQHFMKDPITDFLTGETYDCAWYRGWVEQCGDEFHKSPQRKSENPVFEPNIPLKRAIGEFKLRRPLLPTEFYEAPSPQARSVLLEGICSNASCGRYCQAPLSLGTTDIGAELDLLECPSCQETFFPNQICTWPGSQWTLSVMFREPGMKNTRRNMTSQRCDELQRHELVPDGAVMSHASITVLL